MKVFILIIIFYNGLGNLTGEPWIIRYFSDKQQCTNAAQQLGNDFFKKTDALTYSCVEGIK